ncbi:MAG: type III-B CRISPR-associated protein Cas10/Cmr2, partial [Candidatus Thorarchaeota archaeon]
MPNNDFWLRKIAAFLHDPPYKVWYFGKEYKGQRWERNKDAINLFETYFHPQYPFYNPNNSNQKLGKYRKFHHIAASESKNQYFGLKGSNILFDTGGYIFIHPLSGLMIALEDIFKPDEFNKSLNLKSEVETFLNQLSGDERQKFLELWRFLPVSITHWINLLPVDTILADNTARDLEVMQSAIITTWDDSIALDKAESIKSSFLILEFGPVQKFIANARKTRDLWFSSWLISYLAWKAMKPIVEELGPDNIVYPDLYKQPLVDDWLEKEGVLTKEQWKKESLRLPTLPNTFLAIVPEGKEKDFAIKANQAINDAWGKIVRGVHDLLVDKKKLEKGSPLENEFRRQTSDLPFNIYWLSLKWGNGPEKAIEDYKKLMESDKCWEFERLWKKMETRVNNPNIGDTYAMLVEMAQMGLKAMKYRGKLKVINEPGHKCSLCGERTVLTNGDPNDIKEIKTLWKKMADAFPGHIKANEYLCAVCLVKRLAPKVISQ